MTVAAGFLRGKQLEFAVGDIPMEQNNCYKFKTNKHTTTTPKHKHTHTPQKEKKRKEKHLQKQSKTRCVTDDA